MKRKVLRLRRLLILSIIGILVAIGGKEFFESRTSNYEIKQYAKDKGIPVWNYTDSLISLYERNPETKKFVLEYPEKKNKQYTINLEKYEKSKTVPLLMQWDQRWGYTTYAGNLMGLSGCGPTCLSMVAIYRTGNSKWNPKAVAEFATENGYAVEGNGTAWDLFTVGAKKMGLKGKELSLDETQIFKQLREGNPIICSMGPGKFTSSGHFIVMTGCKDGKIEINDPNSHKNSKKLWEYEEIAGQIKNLWAFY